MNANNVRVTMNATGIGYAGIDGVWWRPAVAPVALPQRAKEQLDDIARAIFALFDTVGTLYDTPEGDACGLTALLRYKVPERFWRFASRAPVLSVRPDFQIFTAQEPDGSQGPVRLEYVATELEICPSAQGYAHAMQLGYGLSPRLLHAMAHLLNGRELICVSTQHWSEFIWEQLAFCKALAGIGARGRVWLDLPIERLAEQVQSGERWEPPIFGVPHKPDQWHDDVLGRIHAHGFAPFLAHDLPDDRSDVAVFRFGYLDCFDLSLLERLQSWEQRGATFLNPTSFLWDSKVVMAALQLPEGTRRIATLDMTNTLNTCIPETHLLTLDTIRHIRDTRANWVLKFAGFDSGQQAWGGRSLQVGARHTDASWRDVLTRYGDLPFPVVAQRITPTATMDIAYLDADSHEQMLHQGRTRLRSFLLRDGVTAQACGTHLTVSGGESGGVSEGIASVQTGVRFET